MPNDNVIGSAKIKVTVDDSAVAPGIAKSVTTAESAAAESDVDKLQNTLASSVKAGAGLSHVLSRLFIPAALIGGAIKLSELIDEWWHKGEKFRRELDGIASSFERTTSAMAASRGGAYNEALAELGQKTQATIEEIQQRTEQAQTGDNWNLMKGILGLGLNTDELAAEAQSQINRVSSSANKQAALLREKHEKEQKDDRDKLFREGLRAQAELERFIDAGHRARIDSAASSTESAYEELQRTAVAFHDNEEANIKLREEQQIASLKRIYAQAQTDFERQLLDTHAKIVHRQAEVELEELKRTNAIKLLENQKRLEEEEKQERASYIRRRQFFQQFSAAAVSLGDASGESTDVSALFQKLDAIRLQLPGRIE